MWREGRTPALKENTTAFEAGEPKTYENPNFHPAKFGLTDWLFASF